MLLVIFTGIYLFFLALQIFIPYLVQETIVFGVTVPEQYRKHPSLRKAKKLYTYVMLYVGLALLLLMHGIIWMMTLSEPIQVVLFNGLLFGMLAVSMILYWINHRNISNLKKTEQWGQNLKQVRAVDLTARNRDEMLPWPFFIAPMGITAFLMIFILLNYNQLPNSLAVHWGPSGEADDFVEKTYFTALSLPLVMLMMQCIMWGVVDSIKHSAIKLAVHHQEASLESQLKTRKIASWFSLLTSYGITVLLTVLQLSNIYPELAEGKRLLPFFMLFLVVVIGGVLLLVWNMRKERLKYTDNVLVGVTDVDEDRYWKGGIFYVNREDPSIFVAKRFGVGWTLNFANPRGYVVFVLPLVILLLISIFSL